MNIYGVNVLVSEQMNIRTRKFIGMFGLLGLLLVYSLAVMRFAVAYVLDLHGVLQGLFFVVGGVLWLPPAMMLIKWMQRPDEDAAG